MQRRKLLIANLGHQLLDAFVFGDVVVGFTDLKVGIQVQSLWRGNNRRFCVSIEDHSAHNRVLVDARLQHWKEWLFAMFEAQRFVKRVGAIDDSDYDSPLMTDILSRDTTTLVGAFAVLEVYIRCTEKFCLTR